MKKNRDQDSSLELLLDTMCNTFGGVMFIAIALTVVLSITSKMQPDDLENADLDQLQQQLVQLRHDFSMIQQKTKSQQAMLDLLKNDPRRLLLQKIVELKESIKNEKIEYSLLSAEEKTAAQQENAAIAKNREVTGKHVELTRQKQQENIEKEKDRLETQKLTKELQETVSLHITFKTVNSIKALPYYFIVNDNRLWRVGPDGDSVSDMTPNKDVEFTENDGRTTCTIAPGVPGVPMLDSNGKMSSEARALLNAVPSGRTPKFSVHSNSLADFCKFREVQKKENVVHGIDTFFNRDNNLTYEFSRKAKNEVYQ